jgi:tRNA 2-selenouridine synthase
LKQPETTTLDQFVQPNDFNRIIDVRSPAEFEEDHIPGAINCPVLSNEERVIVGTLYKQVSAFEAKKVGGALVARNIAQHMDEQFRQHGKDWKPLVYCWRGGSRSGAMTHILRQVGWQASQLEGGYKTWRRHVLETLQTLPAQFQYKVICGETGSAKTRILEALAQQGAQVLDLEKLALHKGSVLGVLMDQDQPSQKYFETLVCHALGQFDATKPVYIEAESKKIGRLRLPELLFETMKVKGELIRIEASVQARVEFLLRDYDYFLTHSERLKSQLSFLFRLHGKQVIDGWHSLIEQGEWAMLVEQLLVQHYDPAYRKSMEATYAQLGRASSVVVSELGPDQMSAIARQILAQ